MFNWVKELKDEIKAAVNASIELRSEIARLQECARRLDVDVREIRDALSNVLESQNGKISDLRDRIAGLEAQQQSLHNDARLLAAQYAVRPSTSDSNAPRLGPPVL
jgi:BMFP domain-containing protein YqiC